MCATARTCRNVISCVDLPTRPMSVLPRSESLRHHLDDSDRLRRFSRDPSGRFHRVKLAGLASWTRVVGPDEFSRLQNTHSVCSTPRAALAELGPSVIEVTSIRVCRSRPISRESGIMFSESRVERWRGGLGRSLYSPLARPFVCECHNISTMLRFHLPLIKPDVRFSRIRLSDKDSCVRPRNVAVAQAEFNKT